MRHPGCNKRCLLWAGIDKANSPEGANPLVSEERVRTPSQQPQAQNTTVQETVTQNVVAQSTVAPDAVAQSELAQDLVTQRPVPQTSMSKQDAPISASKFGAGDIERFSRNMARLVEEGGRALAAYLRPREQGRLTAEVADELGEITKTLGHVAEYWLADPQRAAELQIGSAKPISNSGRSPPSGFPASRPPTSSRRPPATRNSTIRNGRRTSFSTSSSSSICSPRNGPISWSRTPTVSMRIRGKKRSFTSARSSTRSPRPISC